MAIPQPRLSPEDRWVKIPYFHGYSVSDTGLVRNDDSGRLMIRTLNQQGIVQVGMNRLGVQYRRSVAVMVASAFVPLPEYPYYRKTFDTPTHLDGDRTNLHASNLVWRPRWFAVLYHKQFKQDLRNPMFNIEDPTTGEIFYSSWEIVLRYGVLHNDLVSAIWNDQMIFPHRIKFKQIFSR